MSLSTFVIAAALGNVACLAVGYVIGATHQRVKRLRIEYYGAVKLAARLGSDLSRDDLRGLVESLCVQLLEELKPWGPGEDVARLKRS